MSESAQEEWACLIPSVARLAGVRAPVSVIQPLLGDDTMVWEGKYLCSTVAGDALTCSFLTGYPLHGRLPGRPGLGGYWGVCRAMLLGDNAADIRAGSFVTETSN